MQEVSDGEDQEVAIMEKVPERRWVVHAAGAKKIVMTDHCIAACCDTLGKHLSKAKRHELAVKTRDRFSMMMKSYKNLEKAVMNMCSEERHKCNMTFVYAQQLMEDIMVDNPGNIPAPTHNIRWLRHEELVTEEGYEPTML